MNKHAVKQLTKEGCIVEKEAAETLTEEDIDAIRSMDTTPMYITSSMVESLRSRQKDLDSAGSQKIKQKETVEKVEVDDKDKVIEGDVEKDSKPEEHTEAGKPNFDEIGEKDEQNGSETVEIKDTGRKDLRTKIEILDQKEVSREEKDVPEFLQYYNDRYDKMKKMLMRRKELQAATTLNRLERKEEGETASTIGMVRDKYSTSSGKYIVELEDKTTTFKALVNERNGDRIVQDEVIGVIGNMGGDIIYGNSVIRPDIPIPDGVNTTEEKVEAAYISDLHLGSQDTMKKKFDKFGDWLNSREAKDIGYLVIAGDIVEGVGTYPGQEEELEVTDIYSQYELFEEWIEKVPERIQIVIGPGNHDVTRLAEPQPRLPEKALPDISDYNNVHLVQNPQTVRLHGIESKGITNLMYHGYSFDAHVDQIQDLRDNGYEEPEHVMIDLLKRRHLAPTYGSNNMSPEGEDHMVIQEKPDVFVAGHFHSHANESYKGVNVVCSSSFQRQTEFQKRVGHQPDPGKVTIIDYKTRNTRVKRFV